MLYKDFKGLQLSELGMGNMRLPTIGGDDNHVDTEKAVAVIRGAYERGVNYFDTAWGYHGGNSETTVREALSVYPRESYYLADKFPGYDLANFGKQKEIFAEQLKRCGVEYFDFYLLHNVCELNIEQYLDPKNGVLEYFLAEKAAGRIKHLGFSCHAELPALRRFLEAYGEHMEFCQIQLNLLDWEFQHADEKVKLLGEYNLPVWVMEPLRGGSLLRLPESAEAKLREARPGESNAAWAFNFVRSVPGVTMILSGMNSTEQLDENCALFSADAKLNDAEFELCAGIGRSMLSGGVVPCTACHYCVSHCPQGLDIPRLLALYNEHAFSGGGFIAPFAVAAIEPDKRPNNCISCHSCTSVCPQKIEIPETLAKFSEMMGL